MLEILTPMTTFSITLITTDDPCLPNHVNSFLSFVTVREDPTHPSKRTETRIRVKTISIQITIYVLYSGGVQRKAHVSDKTSTTSKKLLEGTPLHNINGTGKDNMASGSNLDMWTANSTIGRIKRLSWGAPFLCTNDELLQ
jgi:hypothetical protein